jgi:ketosteroid isomerase-like protein
MGNAANEELIRRFYDAFGRKDLGGMAACYAPDVRFSDPVFPSLRGPEVMAMWTMLGGAPGERNITCSNVHADDQKGSAHWDARYTFSQTGRPVHNVIDATFTFADGKIATHQDHFDFWRWSRQALGPAGLVLGWSPILKGSIRKKAATRLADFQARPR